MFKFPSRTSFGMRMRNLSFLSKKVRRYGHILKSVLFMRMKTKFVEKNIIFLKNNRFSLKKKFDLAGKKFYILIKILLILFFSCA